MEVTEKPIQDRLINGNIPPMEAVHMRSKLAGLYSFYSSQLEEILLQKPASWNVMRQRHKSDSQCDKEWEATDMGRNEMGLAMRLKRIEKMMSALASIITMANVDYTHTK